MHSSRIRRNARAKNAKAAKAEAKNRELRLFDLEAHSWGTRLRHAALATLAFLGVRGSSSDAGQPAGLDAGEAAPIICAGITTYKGIKETGARPGEWIAISGVGGLGHLAVQYAKVMGHHVCAVDIDDGKLAHAKSLGADVVVNAKVGDPAATVKKETGGGAHGVLITAPSLPAFKQGVGMTRKRGTCVLVGLPPGEFPVSLFDVVANCITIRGSFVGTRQDLAEALAFAAEGKVKADIELQPLSAVNRVFERLEKGDVASRVVLEIGSG